MFRVGGRFPVGGYHRPAIVKDLSFTVPDIQHWLDRETVARSDLLFCARSAIVRYLGRLMHPAADTVTSVIANNAISVLFRMLLNDCTDIANPLIRPALLDPKSQTLLGYAN
jgi:hypothetical protein